VVWTTVRGTIIRELKTRIALTDFVRDRGTKGKINCDAEAFGISGYAAPEMVSLGSSRSLIQGYWPQGWDEWGSNYKHGGD
jgi:hypothetical protein